MNTNEKVPVTILTGFLGSGKTTLLNRILTEEHGKRIAVIENEFGEVGIDQGLVINADEEVFEMSNSSVGKWNETQSFAGFTKTSPIHPSIHPPILVVVVPLSSVVSLMVVESLTVSDAITCESYLHMKIVWSLYPVVSSLS